MFMQFCVNIHAELNVVCSLFEGEYFFNFRPICRYTYIFKTNSHM